MKISGASALQKLARYKLELQEAVKKEEYEKAARLRDRIKNLQKDMTKVPPRPKGVSFVAPHLSNQ